RRRIRPLAEDQLTRPLTLADRRVDDRRAVDAARAFDLPDVRDEILRVRLTDHRRKQERTAVLLEITFVLVLPHDDDLDEERKRLPPAPRLALEQSGHLTASRVVGPLRPVTNQHLRERVAGKTRVEWLVLPFERKLAGALDGRAHRCAGSTRPRNGLAAVLVIEQ